MLLVASETGHVYTFATKKLQPMITSEAGKALIQTCLHSPEEGENQGFRRLPPIIYISSLQMTEMTSPFNFLENIELEIPLWIGSFWVTVFIRKSEEEKNRQIFLIICTLTDESSFWKRVILRNCYNLALQRRLEFEHTDWLIDWLIVELETESVDQRMSAVGFEETELHYDVEDKEDNDQFEQGQRQFRFWSTFFSALDKVHVPFSLAAYLIFQWIRLSCPNKDRLRNIYLCFSGIKIHNWSVVKSNSSGPYL